MPVQFTGSLAINGSLILQSDGEEIIIGTTGSTNLSASYADLALDVINKSIFTEVTYDELTDLITSSSLSTGGYYLITDFQTCYDQPDFDNFKNPIFSNNYRTASIDPILVLAISNDNLSPNAYQPSYPNDKIQYDWSWNLTEATNNPAKGRITERIDEFNNRTDYDHRTILFKRYDYIELNMSNPLTGSVDVVAISPTLMSVTGSSTLFTSLVVGGFVGFGDIENFRAFEIVSITNDTEMEIFGSASFSNGGLTMYEGFNQSDTSYYQNNVSTTFTEYYTFDYSDTNINNYIGNYANLYDWDENPFILANNVFKGSSYINNTFGNNCFNNTFDDDCSNNIIGNSFYNNITDDDFDGNVIGNWFNNNRITSNFQYNKVGENFQNNYLVQDSFYRNNIGNYFEFNIIDGDDFQNNEIGNQFANNVILNGQFYKNDIGNGYNNNKIYSQFYGNLIGNGFNGNDIYCQFTENNIGEIFENNNIGDSLNLGLYNFQQNKIGTDFINNTCLGTFAYNQIENYFENNTIGDGFGFGYSTSQGNKIGNYFYNNNIGEYFYNNVVADGFYSNTIADYFQLNDIKFSLSSTDFSLATHVYGNYNCTLFLRNDSSNRLSYIDNSDVINYANIND